MKFNFYNGKKPDMRFHAGNATLTKDDFIKIAAPIIGDAINLLCDGIYSVNIVNVLGTHGMSTTVCIISTVMHKIVVHHRCGKITYGMDVLADGDRLFSITDVDSVAVLC